ncbi:WhiB family transcriptional regulator [Streptomyces sp.]|uniref:WhiB family transcriptional regulator n=1 Tax=Streptomyces sp. TaxID=1931 RepID=UPI0028123EB4|nr:WhiB family transcriptional regulator [Streptomyces sp.]
MSQRTAAWTARALCAQPPYRGVDFFPQPNDQRSTAKAVAVCADCPVWRDCLTDALRTEGGSRPEYRHGIRGGLTGYERYASYRRVTQNRRRARQAAAR